MPDLAEGQRVTVQGSGANSYELARDGSVYSCSCPAWRNIRLPIVQRRCKHLIAYLGDTPLASVTPRALRPAMRTFQSTRWQVEKYEEAPEVRRRREAVLEETLENHVVLFDKMEEVYGLRLPVEIAWVAGFYLALDDAEKAEAAKWATSGLIGVGAWFLPEGEMPSVANERLRDRHPEDPPELVPVMSGTEAGSRYALLYDEPSELPTGIVYRRGRTTTLCKATLLESLHDRFTQLTFGLLPIDSMYPEGIGGAGGVELLEAAVAAVRAGEAPGAGGVGDEPAQRRRRAIHAWLEAVLQKASTTIETGTLAFQGRGWKPGSFTLPYVPGWRVPEDLAGAREYEERHVAYAAQSPVIDEWFARAEADLSDGSPGRALFFGRELHLCGEHEGLALRAKASELLIRAYAMLGRTALIETVRAQHLALHPDVSLYELPPPHPIALAAEPADVAAAWTESPPTEADIEEAFKRVMNADVFDAIFERVDGEIRERAARAALARRLNELLGAPGTVTAPGGGGAGASGGDRAALLHLIGRFVQRTAIDTRSFERILRAGDPFLDRRAAESVTLDSTWQGTTPLHVAARDARIDLVKVLLERGIDAKVKNARGRMAFDDAMTASDRRPREAHEVLLLLEAAGGGRGKVPSRRFEEDAATWAIGDVVHHPKFGDGVVEKVEGTGDDAKLQIAFTPVEKEEPKPSDGGKGGKGSKRSKSPPKVTKEVKTLLGKFVQRR